MHNHLYTAQGKNLPEIPLNTYPRPTLKRDSFYCLNGKWDFCAGTAGKPEYNEKIVVPYCPESLLSGINRTFKKGNVFYYRKTFSLPENFIKNRVLLHFGAVNQKAQVYLNGEFLGEHIGGYTPFFFEVSHCLRDENILEVRAINDFEDFILPYGKQRRKRGGMWYTPASGIWQTVWLESVPGNYIKSVEIKTNLTSAGFIIEGAQNGEIKIFTPDGELIIPFKNGQCKVTLENPKLWSPEEPYLYYCTVTTDEDTVETYFALRTLEIAEVKGISRTLLNGRPYFFHGLLDQGYFSDGIFTPADMCLYEQDIKTAKALGFNMLRKHIKIEPEQFYYDCDRLGMIVFQDMVNNGNYSFIRDTALPTVGFNRLPSIFNRRTPSQRVAFFEAMEQTVKLLSDHPSICCWTIFNEGWGQFNTDDMYGLMLSLDNSRFIDTASGWFKTKYNDFESEHIYFKRVKLRKSKKPIFLSEFGGYSYKPEGHIFNTEKTYGYRLFENREDFENALLSLYENEIIPFIKEGLCATVYTQLTDVEDETNGLISYDREVVKVDSERMNTMADKLFNEILK